MFVDPIMDVTYILTQISLQKIKMDKYISKKNIKQLLTISKIVPIITVTVITFKERRPNMAALKYSRQREAIVNFLKTRYDHPTADVVYSNVRTEFPNISLGTVYRNLTLLADLGEIARLHLGDGVDHFDYNTNPHYHFVCSECGGVSDLETPEHIVVDTAAFQNFGGEIHGYSVHFYGVCPHCKGNASSEAQTS